jgi:hypothetical protein
VKDKKTNYPFLLIVTIIASVLTLLILANSEIQIINAVTVKGIKSEIKSDKPLETKQVEIEDMVLNVGKRAEISESKDQIILNIPGIYKGGAGTNYQTYEKEIIITVMKGLNEKKEPLDKWFSVFDPQDVWPSVEEYQYAKKQNINTNNFIKTLYTAPTSLQNSNFYDVLVDYFAKDTDIYQIIYFHESEDKEITLTVDQEKSIKNYEKIVDQILNSIHFVE